jgi:hypothetical protein
MRYFSFIYILFCQLALFNGCFNSVSRDRRAANQEQVALADSLLSYFQQEQFDQIVAHFDDKMKLQLSKERLAIVWSQLSMQAGKVTKSEFYKAHKINNVGDRVVYQCHFTYCKLYFQVVFGKENRISGLFFTPQIN